jgi:hypothetical protein
MMLVLDFFPFRKRHTEEDHSEELTIKRTRTDNKDPPGDEIREEEGLESEAETTSSAPDGVVQKLVLVLLNRPQDFQGNGREHWLEYINGQGMFCKLCKYNQQSYGHIWSRTACSR